MTNETVAASILSAVRAAVELAHRTIFGSVLPNFRRFGSGGTLRREGYGVGSTGNASSSLPVAAAIGGTAGGFLDPCGATERRDR
jgi:hypothetical protein